MLTITIRRAEQERRYAIHRLPGRGWEATLEENHQLTRRAVYRDWHRVERVRNTFMRQIEDLTAEGWQAIDAQ